jgi:hypothetical protein
MQSKLRAGAEVPLGGRCGLAGSGGDQRVHTELMASWSWRDRLWFGLAIFIGVSVALLIGPIYLDPLPLWLKVVIAIAGTLIIATAGIYSRRRARHA